MGSTAFDVQLGRRDVDDLPLLALRGPDPLLLDVQQQVVVDPIDDVESTRVVAYTYRLLVVSEVRMAELVAFHWTPTAEPPQRTYPHMHVGSMVTAGSRFRPKDFNRLHIPTGPVSLEAVLLFAVEELGVETAPGRERDAILDQLRAGESRLSRAVGDATD